MRSKEMSSETVWKRLTVNGFYCIPANVACDKQLFCPLYEINLTGGASILQS